MLRMYRWTLNTIAFRRGIALESRREIAQQVLGPIKFFDPSQSQNTSSKEEEDNP
jgi:hypothetical protein